MAMIITSVQNPRIKHLVALRDRRERERDGLMLVDGYDELSLAVRAGRPISLFYCSALFRDRAQSQLIEQARQAGAELVEVNERVFEKIAYRDTPDGWLGVFPLLRRGLADLAPGPNPFLVVMEAVEKPGNLGAILRTADAAGIDALISCDPVTDLGNPNVVRSSKGTVFSVPVAEARSEETIAWLREHGIAIVAATPQARPLYTEVDLSGPVAIAVGAEKPGLSDAWLRQADLAVRIPMFGTVNSLNVSTAAALLIYETVKQRQATIDGRRTTNDV
jgi:RNA methyltransferase, TrmH family